MIPQGLLQRLRHGDTTAPATFGKEKKQIERIAMDAVMARERKLGFEPRDVSSDNCGYDVESRCVEDGGRLRFIEVKGRQADADTVTVSKNEILTGLNKPDDFILAVALVDGDSVNLHYIEKPFENPPDFGATSVNYRIADLLTKGNESI